MKTDGRSPLVRTVFFSVLVPVVERAGELNLLFEVRAKNMKSQPGEICFPGGHVEKGETPQQAALRETFEEIGIDRQKIELIGPGDILYGYANYTLFTYMGIIGERDLQAIQPGRRARWTRSFSFLCAPLQKIRRKSIRKISLRK